MNKLNSLNFLNITGAFHFPICFANLNQLLSVNLINCNLKEIPKAIIGLKNLRDLNIQGNNIVNILEEIGEIKSLEILRIDFNSNLILPQNIFNKNKLRVDFITYNKIDTEKAKKLLIKFGKSRKQYRNDDEIYFWVVDEQLNKDN